MLAFNVELIYRTVCRNAFIMQIENCVFTDCINFKYYKSTTVVSFYSCERHIKDNTSMLNLSHIHSKLCTFSTFITVEF